MPWLLDRVQSLVYILVSRSVNVWTSLSHASDLVERCRYSPVPIPEESKKGRAVSSVGQSVCLTSRRSSVRAGYRPPLSGLAERQVTRVNVRGRRSATAA